MFSIKFPSYIIQPNYSEVHSANLSLANFVKDSFTYLDRGFVFKLVNIYIEHFNHQDPKVNIHCCYQPRV